MKMQSSKDAGYGLGCVSWGTWLVMFVKVPKQDISSIMVEAQWIVDCNTR